MAPLNISKVAVGCASFESLARRQRARSVGGAVPAHTRFRPKRSEELLGGSIYWIVRHQLVGRQTILGFGEDSVSGRTVIRLEERLVRVHPQPRRAHQGWRYLAGSDCPEDLDERDAGALPPCLAEQLSALALI